MSGRRDCDLERDRQVRQAPFSPEPDEARVARTAVEFDHPGLQIDQALLIQSQVQALEYLVECPLGSPAPKPLIHRQPWAKALWHISLRSTRAEPP